MELLISDHNNGLNVVPDDIKNNIINVLETIRLFGNNITGQKIRLTIIKNLISSGWSDRIVVSPESQITITGINRNVGLCVQFGNMARFYADLLKLQALHDQEKINSAIYIIPTKYLAKQLLTNMANYDRLIQELFIFRKTIRIPMIIIGVEKVD